MTLSERPWNDLIDLYAEHPVREIMGLPEHQKLCKEYEEKGGFANARNLVEKVAVNVQNRMSKALGPVEECIAALELLRRTRAKPEEMELYYMFLMKGYGAKWPLKLQTYCKEGYQKLCLPYDFFFSFSTRYEGVATENPVNSSYKHFILKVLGREDWESADRKKENLLAKAVYILMAENKGHKGFYFPDSQYDNTFTEKKLEAGLRDAHVFVQMVQNVMFRPPIKGENYCHFEFVRAFQRLEAEGQVEDRMLFLIAEKQQAFFKAKDVYLDYDNWFQTIAVKDPPYVPEVPIPLQANVRYQQIKALIEEKLVAKVDAAWDHLIDNVPQN